MALRIIITKNIELDINLLYWQLIPFKGKYLGYRTNASEISWLCFNLNWSHPSSIIPEAKPWTDQEVIQKMEELKKVAILPKKKRSHHKIEDKILKIAKNIRKV